MTAIINNYPVINWQFSVEDIYMITNNIIKKSKYIINKLTSQQLQSGKNINDFVSLLADDITEYTTFASICNFLKNISTDINIIKACCDSNKLITDYLFESNKNQKMFTQLIILNKLMLKNNSSNDDIIFINKVIKSYKRSGVNLDKHKKNKLIKLKSKIDQLENKIKNNKKSPQIIKLDVNIIDTIPKKKIEINNDDGILQLNKNNFNGIMTYAIDEKIRKKVEYIYDGSYENMHDLLMLNIFKNKYAKLLAYKSFGYYQIDNNLIIDTNTIKNLTDLLLEYTDRAFNDNMKILTKLKDSDIDNNTETLASWDIQYYLTKIKNTIIDDNVNNNVNLYFKLNTTVKNILTIYEHLLNLKFIQITEASVWHPSVIMYKIVDNKLHDDTPVNMRISREHDTILGYFYLDLYNYNNKNCQPSCIKIKPNCVYPHNLNEYQQPISVLIANYHDPYLLSVDDIFILIHELSFIIHHICDKSKYCILNGTNLEYDFVELIAKLFERIFLNKKIIKDISAHFITGDKIPDDLLDKIISVREFENVINIRKQCMYSLYDQLACSNDFNLYIKTIIKSKNQVGETIKQHLIEIYKQIHEKVFPKILTQNIFPFANYFSNITGLEGMYYTNCICDLLAEIIYNSKFTQYCNYDTIDSKTDNELRKILFEKDKAIDGINIIKQFVINKNDTYINQQSEYIDTSSDLPEQTSSLFIRNIY